MAEQLGAQVAGVVSGADYARVAREAAGELGGEEEVADLALGVVGAAVGVADGGLLLVVPRDAVLGGGVDGNRGGPGDAHAVWGGGGGRLLEEREEELREEEGAEAVGAHLEFVALVGGKGV